MNNVTVHNHRPMMERKYRCWGHDHIGAEREKCRCTGWSLLLSCSDLPSDPYQADESVGNVTKQTQKLPASLQNHLGKRSRNKVRLRESEWSISPKEGHEKLKIRCEENAGTFSVAVFMFYDLGLCLTLRD
jgi:hypothetical protein